MKHTFNWKLITAALLVGAAFSCQDSSDGSLTTDNYDRTHLLTYWADSVIVPGFSDYGQRIDSLHLSVTDFTQSPTADGLIRLQKDFVSAYTAWQDVSLFDIGPAEAKLLRNHTNVYPTDTVELKDALMNSVYSFDLPSTYDIQGFPALDFMLFGRKSLTKTLQLFQNSSAHRQYLEELSSYLNMKTQDVVNEWVSSYRFDFIARSGSSASGSVNKLANDFVYHYEKELRAGKVGIPAGVFSGSPLPNRVEALYSDTLSKVLLLRSIDAHKRFFEGISHDSTTNGPSLGPYLDHLGRMRNGKLLSSAINDQFLIATQQVLSLSMSMREAVELNNVSMLSSFDELQKNVPLLKVDMMQTLNIRIDYVDADGD
jgi:hypothetical protein